MDKVQKMKQEKQYEEYVKQKTPQHNVWLNMLKAFITGGTICVIGQVFYHYCELQKLRSRRQAVLGRQDSLTTPWLTERHGYDPTYHGTFN